MSSQGGTTGQSELALSGLPRRLFTATPTRLTTWLDCPRRYRFTYLDRPPPAKGPPWAHNSLGASDGFRDDDQSTHWRERARTMVERYAERLDPRDEPLGVERTVATRTAVLALSGRIDRLDDRVGVDGSRELVVVDYKTSRRVPSVFDVRSSLALALYALAVSRTFRRPCVTVELHHVPSGEVVAHEHTQESLDRHLGRAESLAVEASVAGGALRSGLDDAAAVSTFPAQPSSSCRWCDFPRVCLEGSAQYQPAEPWAALAELPAG